MYGSHDMRHTVFSQVDGGQRDPRKMERHRGHKDEDVGKGGLNVGVQSHALSKWCLMIGIMWEASCLGMSRGRLQRRSDA